MSNRQKLELPLNTPVNLELLFDEPVTGSNRFGSYYLYAVKSGEEEFSFFAPESVHEELKNFKRGEHVAIKRSAANRNGKLITTYSVEKLSNGSIEENEKAKATNKKASDGQVQQPEYSDHYFDTMLRSYRDALRIQGELNGLTDVNRIAITLFIARSKLPFNGNTN